MDNDIDREMERRSNGFHVEEGRLLGARRAIVCDQCDEIGRSRVSLDLTIGSSALDDANSRVPTPDNLSRARLQFDVTSAAGGVAF